MLNKVREKSWPKPVTPQAHPVASADGRGLMGVGFLTWVFHVMSVFQHMAAVWEGKHWSPEKREEREEIYGTGYSCKAMVGLKRVF